MKIENDLIETAEEELAVGACKKNSEERMKERKESKGNKRKANTPIDSFTKRHQGNKGTAEEELAKRTCERKL